MKSGRLLLDIGASWHFHELPTGEFAPANPLGFIRPHQEWETLKRRVDTCFRNLPKVALIRSICVQDPVYAEQFLHNRFAREHTAGEWCALSLESLTWLLSLAEHNPPELQP